jgi:tryptophanyl-tRNA synthetase
MKTILTGIQPTGKIHIGNYFGAIKPLFSLQKENKAILFIADMHSMTTIPDAKIRKDNIYHMLAALIALGYDFKKDILFKQSDVPEVAELSFYLSCLTPFNTLDRAHAFQDKKDNIHVNTGIFTYPVLMAADILLYGTELVPVGKDQMQHLEITRTLANKFNVLYNETFKVPEPYKMSETKTIVGTDGKKMSKSYNNTLEIFASEDDLRKKIYRIPTSSAGVDDPKDYENCNLFKLYSLFAFEAEIEDMKNKYKEGIAYSKVKKELLDRIIDDFSEERDLYNKICENKDFLDAVLYGGRIKAREIAIPKMDEIRFKLGFKFN